MLQQSRRKAAQEYGLPLPIKNLCSCIPQPLHCLCPMPEDSGDEGGSSKTGERADLLPNSGESYSTASREGVRSQ
nr:YSPL-1 form 4 [Mus musculus]